MSATAVKASTTASQGPSNIPGDAIKAGSTAIAPSASPTTSAVAGYVTAGDQLSSAISAINSTTPGQAAALQSSNSASSGSSNGLKLGVGLGVGLGALLIGSLVTWILIRRIRKRERMAFAKRTEGMVMAQRVRKSQELDDQFAQ